MRMKRPVVVAAWFAVFGLVLAGCAPLTTMPAQSATPVPSEVKTAVAEPARSEPTPILKPAADQPRYGGVLTMAVSAEPASFDIHQEAAGQHTLYLTPAYNGLIQHDPLAWPEQTIIPDLASSWDVSPDGLLYTFHLRTGVKWHDGRAFTSEDAKASLDRIRIPPKGMKSPRGQSFPSVSAVQAVGPDTLTIRLSHPSASLVTNLANDWLAVLPKHIIEANGDMKLDIMGTGPFKFKGYTPGSSYEFTKNTDYFVKGRPYLDGIRLYVVMDDATRLAAFRTGRVLYLPFPVGITSSQAEIVKASPRFVVQRESRPALVRLLFNLNKPPLNDLRVRRAVSLGFDRQAFVAAVLEGDGILGASMPSRGPWGIPEEQLLRMPGYRQPKDGDVAEAKRLLVEAGFADGFKTSVITRSGGKFEKYGTFTLAELAKLGIKGELVMRVTASFEDALIKGAFDMMAHGEATALDDPDLRYGDFYISKAGRNYGKYSSPEVDSRYERQSRTLDTGERKRIVREMQAILLRDIPDIPLAWQIQTIAHDRRVRNYRVASSGNLNNRYQEVWLAD
ncbi:MAG: ABC transporter substrate-binding protein [Chloroflexi bacterium]|nr:ABC transporter substrate-binding protein [Chloroflexota bacterium]